MIEFLQKLVELISLKKPLTALIFEITQANMQIQIEPDPIDPDLFIVRIIDLRNNRKESRAIRVDRLVVGDIRVVEE